MSVLTNYGVAIAATTLAVQELLAGPPAGIQVTARAPGAARVGISGASVNVFLHSDGLISYREESVRRGTGRMIAELYYLVSAYPADDEDADALSQEVYGTARALIERRPMIRVHVGKSESMQVWLSPTPFTVQGLTSLWQSFGTPLRLSFGLMASFALDASARPVVIGTIKDVVTLAGVGTVAIFSGPDGQAKAVAAASVAKTLGKPLVKVSLAEIASKDSTETQLNLRRVLDPAAVGGAVLLIEGGEALFGMRPDVLDLSDPYAEVDVGLVLEQAARAAGLVIISVEESVGEELADRAGVEVRFPPEKQ